MWNAITSFIAESTSAFTMNTAASTAIKQAANVIPLPKHPKVLMKASWAPSEPALSPKRGLHKATLLKTTTVVPEVPGKVCPVQTFTFRLDGYPSLNVTEHVRLECGDTIKVYLQEKNEDGTAGKNWTFKSYSPTDTSRPGEIGITVKLYPDGQNAKMLRSLQEGQDHIYLAGPWRRKQRLPTSHAYLIAFGIGITEIYPVAKQLVQDGVPTTILCANRFREDVCFRNELDQMAEKNAGHFGVKYIYSRENVDSLAPNEFVGRLDSAKALGEALGLETNEDKKTDANVCTTAALPRFLAIGSKPMMRQAWNCLHDLGYARNQYELLQSL